MEDECMITVAIADDHPLAREGIKNALEHDPHIRVIAEAKSGLDLEAALRPAPDVLILDIHMPGFKADTDVPRLQARYPEMKIVIVTASDSGTLVQRLMGTVHGYLLKSEDMDAYASVVHEVCSGRISFSKEAVELAVNTPQVPTLSERELEVLELAARGQKTPQIARQLYLSERTVESHLRSAAQKLGVYGRTAAVAKAVELKLVSVLKADDTALHTSPPKPGPA
jgi:DNA-binding NarL/FixJ family response regulator